MKKVFRKLLVHAAILLCPLILSSCSTVDAVTGESVYNFYSIQQDVAMGQETIQSNVKAAEEQGISINGDPVRVEQLSTMTMRIAEVSDLPQLPYNVTLIHTNVVNAAAAPGGSMMVFEGLYDPEVGIVKNEDELAAVMAHEIAHVNCRHSTERLSVLMTAAIGAEVLAAVLEHNDESGWADGIRMGFAVGAIFTVPVYSRKDEYEADRIGLFYMSKAGYDPRAAPRLWKRVAEKDGQEHNSASIFATHPSSWDRYEVLNSLVPYAMDEYAAATGAYPEDYTPPDWYVHGAPPFDWRKRHDQQGVEASDEPEHADTQP